MSRDRTRKAERHRLRFRKLQYEQDGPDCTEAKADEKEKAARRRLSQPEKTTITQPLCKRQGATRKKSGSYYKVIRLKLMVNKATTPCLLMQPPHQDIQEYSY